MALTYFGNGFMEEILSQYFRNFTRIIFLQAVKHVDFWIW